MRLAITAAIALVFTACLSGAPEASEPIHNIENSLPEIDLSQGVPWGELAALQGEAALTARMEHYGVPGVSAAVAENFEIVWVRALGVLSTETEAPVDTGSLFEAGSATKAVTALAVHQLASKGRLALDDAANSHLTSWRIPDSEQGSAEAVTLRRLLSHTGGINRPEGGFAIAEGGKPTTVQVLAGEAPAINLPLSIEYEPGSKQQYSNFGYVLLQQVIEDVSGTPFAEYMTTSLLAPLGLDASSFDQSRPALHAAGAASPHTPDGTAHTQTLHPSALGNGGLWTTPSDLCRLAVEIMHAQQGRKPRLLDPAAIRAALSVEREIDPAENAGFKLEGLGFFLLPTKAGHAFCHPGFNAPGATCLFIGLPESGQAAVIMTNGARGLELSLELLAAIAADYDWPPFFD